MAQFKRLLLQKLRHQICDFNIVQIRERKMRVAANACFRQMHDGHVAAMAVHGVRPESGHLQAHPPVVLPRICRRLIRNVVAEIDDNRDFGEPQEFRKGDADPSSVPAEPIFGGGTSPFGKDELLPGS